MLVNSLFWFWASEIAMKTRKNGCQSDRNFSATDGPGALTTGYREYLMDDGGVPLVKFSFWTLLAFGHFGHFWTLLAKSVQRRKSVQNLIRFSKWCGSGETAT